MTNSKTVVLAVVLSLALAALAVIVGAVVLGVGGHVVPDSLWTLAGTAVGAIAGLLARTSTEPDPTIFHATPILSTLEQTDPGATSGAAQSHVTEFAYGGGILSVPHDATFTTGTREAFIPSASAEWPVIPHNATFTPGVTATAVDGSTVSAPKQPAKVAHARATRTAPPVAA